MKKTVACFAKGFRTLMAAGSLVVVGLLNIIGTLDLTPLVGLFIENEKYIGVAMLAIGALFGWLRYITSTPLAVTDKDTTVDWANDPNAPHKRGIDSGE